MNNKKDVANIFKLEKAILNKYIYTYECFRLPARHLWEVAWFYETVGTPHD